VYRRPAARKSGRSFHKIRLGFLRQQARDRFFFIRQHLGGRRRLARRHADRCAARHFDRIQSVDSAKLLQLIDRASGELGKTQPVLLGFALRVFSKIKRTLMPSGKRQPASLMAPG